MAIEKVIEYFEGLGIADKIKQFDVSSATVELAAAALGCEGARIAKTLCGLSFPSGFPSFNISITLTRYDLSLIAPKGHWYTQAPQDVHFL